MKVIIIKNCQKGKVNDIIEVADGYAKNFLIKKGFAIPVNSSTQRYLNKKIDIINKEKTEQINTSIKQKEELEKIELFFSLKTTNNIVHGSITNKQILKKLKENGINYIGKYNLKYNSISSIGITEIEVKLKNNIKTKIKIRVGKNGKTT
ncbi:MAG: 50S ribosomal protein L9 [Mycoplasma sp.]|nr:50S ribosomal protein L9 [Mycoplasma sp.]